MIISKKKLMMGLDVAIRIIANHKILITSHTEHSNLNV